MTDSPIELRKIAYRQSAKDGLVITFAVHPNDMPPALAAAPIGARFAAALVEIGDDEQPVKRDEPNPSVQRAGILCNDKQFQTFLRTEWPLDWEATLQSKPFNSTSDVAAAVLRGICGIESRRELADGGEALRKFENVMGKFEGWKLGL